VAASTPDPAVRRRALTFGFVGGGYAGVEAMAELEDMARYALRDLPGIEQGELRWVLVEAAGRIMAEVSTRLSDYTVARLNERGIEVKLDTKLESVEDGHVQLSDGDAFEADTVVWTAGVKANPILQRTDLPRDDAGRLPCAPNLRVKGVTGVFAAGDCAAVPDLTAKDPNALCGPSAQHAVRQAKQLGDNIVAALRGKEVKEYRHAYAGSVASLGLHRGVAEVYGVKLRGLPAWWMHRTYHVARLPTFNRKMRVLADWTLALFFRREIVSLGSFADPRRDFERAATGE
jgi:NADH dehydrogenase